MKTLNKKFHVRVGDTVKILAGNEKGKIGKVIAILKKKDRAIIEGINYHIKHISPAEKTKKGQLKKVEAPLSISNIMIWSEISQIASRVGHKIVDNKKVRYLRKTNEIIDK
jgi:large subunit ribosomal protein L24